MHACMDTILKLVMGHLFFDFIIIQWRTYIYITQLSLFEICSAPVAFITSFVTLFALVIAITKDLPDVEGDRK